VQFLKWFKVIDDQRRPIAVLVLSAPGVVLWGVSFEPVFEWTLIWTYFAAWIVVATSAAGVYGFTRSLPEAITATNSPRSSAGPSSTVPAGGW
jgi:hypothetical protein